MHGNRVARMMQTLSKFIIYLLKKYFVGKKGIKLMILVGCFDFVYINTIDLFYQQKFK